MGLPDDSVDVETPVQDPGVVKAEEIEEGKSSEVTEG